MAGTNMSEPSTLGRYRIEGELGRGMMGVVYRARDPLLERTLALKVIHRTLVAQADQSALFEQRFISEARAAAGVSHPGIVTIHDAGVDPATGTLFLALEYLEGRTLAAVLRGGTRLPWREALRLTRLVAEALHHAHTHGIVHRDVKPANIMILTSGQPKLMDFGIARLSASQLTLAGEVLGTPAYMSPEQLAGEAVDGRSDLFSLGSVLYLLLTGREAFDGANVPAVLSQVCLVQPPAPSTIVPGLPLEVDAAVTRSLAKVPDERYPNGEAFAQDLADLESGRRPRHCLERREPPAPATMGTTVRVLPAKGGRRSILIGAGVVALLAAGVLLVATLRRSLPAGALFHEPASLEIALEHHLRSGTLRVWLDDDLQFEEPLESRVTRRVLSLRLREGSARRQLDVPPGEHAIRVEVEGDGLRRAQTIRGTFESGVPRRLQVSVGLLREMSLDWGG